jgi:hippurate hydrolase
MAGTVTGTNDPQAGSTISATLIERVNATVGADTSRLTAIFKDLHQHPQIAFTETYAALKALGFVSPRRAGRRGRGCLPNRT